jgi:hypothetical protein
VKSTQQTQDSKIQSKVKVIKSKLNIPRYKIEYIKEFINPNSLKIEQGEFLKVQGSKNKISDIVYGKEKEINRIGFEYKGRK